MEQAKEKSYKDAKLCDICIGTSAAPTFLPAHYFETMHEDGIPVSYDLIDGGVAANNPVRLFNHMKHIGGRLACTPFVPSDYYLFIIL